MPEESLETQDLKEQVEQAHEHAEHAHEHTEHGGAGLTWLTWLSFSTACLAALAAVAALQAGSLANQALLTKSDAVLAESEYADNWAEYQSRNIKGYLFDTQGALLATDAEKRDAKVHGDHERDEGKNLLTLAAKLRARVERANRESGEIMERHEVFARSVTLFQIAIAVAAISALSKKRALFWASLASGAIGAVLLVRGFAAPTGAPSEAKGAHPAASAAPGLPEG